MSFLTSTIHELQRRRVIRVATAYALVSWVLLQLGEITFEPLQLPAWSLTALIFTLLLGFPLVMALAWIFDWTKAGIERTAPSGERSSRLRGIALIAVVISLDVAFGYYLYRIYEPAVRGDGNSATPLVSSNAVTAVGKPGNTIAVLPFVDLSAQRDQAYFSHGISEEIHNVLAKVEGLQVAARTSSFAYADETLQRIGELLHVDTVLEGSVRRQDDSVRVTAQLVDTRTGFTLWSNTYDRRIDLILAIQDDIAQSIAAEMVGNYDGLALASPGISAPSSFEAYDLYLQGRELWRSRTPETLAEATLIFQRIIDLDPSFAPAYSGLADTYLLLSNYGDLSTTEALQRAEPLIQTALELDGQLSEGFASLGLLYMNLGRHRAAEAHLRRAIALDGENTSARMWLGLLVGQQGRLAEQQLILEEALAADPINPLLNINLIENELARGDDARARGRIADILRIYPTSTMVLRTAASIEGKQGNFDEAFDYASRALEIAPQEPVNRVVFTHLLLSVGGVQPARAQLQGALDVGGDNGFVFQTRMRYLTMAGHFEEARSVAESRLEALGDAAGATPESLGPHWWLGRLDLLEGNPRGAALHYDIILARAESLPPLFEVDVLTWGAAAQLFSANQTRSETLLMDAERVLNEVRLQGVTGVQLHYLEACIAALKGDHEVALASLALARQAGWLVPWDLEHDARLAELVTRDEFRSLVDELSAISKQSLQAAPQGLASTGAPVGFTASRGD